MKKVTAFAISALFALFSIGVFGLLMTLTYQALQRIFPGTFANQMWGLIVFDIAVICWAVCFIYVCHTVQQYAAAAIGFAVAFIGTLGMVGAEVALSGNLITVDSQQIGQWLVYGFIGVTIVHAALLWMHHFGAPEIAEKINVGIARGEITSEAIKQATAALDVQKAQLAQTITADIVSQVKRDLGLIPVEGTPFEPKQATAQSTSLDDRPAIKVPENVYQELQAKYPNVPGIFTPTPQDEPTTARAPFLDNTNDSNTGGQD